MRRALRVMALAACLAAGIAGAAGSASRRPTLPVPADNAVNAAKAELGRRLFYDADLSIDGTMACATCHEQHRAFADGNATRSGVHGDPGRRNVPGLANVARLPSLTWGDPRVRTLEAQARIPLFGERPIEMGMKGQEAELVRRLGSDACYRRMFALAFPGDGRIDIVNVTRALAAFERGLVSDRSPWDDQRRGRRGALSPVARRGLVAFDRAGCAACHDGPDFTDGRFHAIRPQAVDAQDAGLAEITGADADRGRFRTPSLRNVALTAPYLHDGSASTLEAAIGAHAGTSLDPPSTVDLLAFLNALTDQAFVADARFALPQRACGKKL